MPEDIPVEEYSPDRARRNLMAKGLQVWQGSEPETYRVRHPVLDRSIKVRAFDLPLLARTVEELIKEHSRPW